MTGHDFDHVTLICRVCEKSLFHILNEITADHTCPGRPVDNNDDPQPDHIISPTEPA